MTRGDAPATGALADERALSPVVGVALLVAIVVVLAALLGAMLLDLGESTPQAPKFATFETAYVADGAGNDGNRPYVNVTFRSGERMSGASLYVVDSDGNEVAWEDVWTGGSTVAVGESVHLDGYGSDGALNHACRGEEYRLVHRDDGGEQIVASHEIPRAATGPAAAYC